MRGKFEMPNFENKHLELRFEDGEVCIYATTEGLEKIIEFCNILLENPSKGHIHLEDYEILTDRSEKGVIALFR